MTAADDHVMVPKCVTLPIIPSMYCFKTIGTPQNFHDRQQEHQVAAAVGQWLKMARIDIIIH